MALFQDQLECTEAIANSLVNAIDEPWADVLVTAVLSGESIDTLVMFTRPDGTQGNVAYIPMLARCFYELARLASDESKGLYKQCEFHLRHSGDFSLDFTY